MAPSGKASSDYFCSTGKAFQQRTAQPGSSGAYSTLWPNGKVYYLISPHYNREEQAQIERALDEITNYTCINFIELEINSKTPHIVYDIGNVNESPVGFKNEPLSIILDKSGRNNKITIQHETFHALGLFHEQSRLDRDQHVLIDWDNIEEINKFNFETYDLALTYDVKYDYKSIMHYYHKAFSKTPNDITIYALINGKKEIRLFGGDEATCNDWLKINRMYRCNEFTQQFTKKCPSLKDYTQGNLDEFYPK